MFEDFAVISIEGKSFTLKTDLPIFCKKFENQKSKSSINRYSIIYGSNGSGKTTIANALSFLSSSLKVEAIETIEKEQKEKVDVHFLNSEGKVIENERVLISNTAVFSEKFIKDNILLRESNLENIVFIGTQVDLQNKIDEKLKIKSEYETELSELSSGLVLLQSGKDSLNEQIRSTIKEYYLKEFDSYSNKSIRKNLTENLVKEISSLSLPSDDIVELTQKYKSDKTQYLQARDFENCVSPLPTFDLQFYISKFKEIQDLLRKKIENPKLSERDQKILEIIKQVSYRKELTDQIVNNNLSICPTCFQPIHSNYIENIKVTLHKIFSKDADNHKEQLKNIVIPKLDQFKERIINLPILNNQDLKELDNLLKSYEIVCQPLIVSLNRKQDNLYEIINFDIKPIVECLLRIDSFFISINNKIDTHNKNVKNIQALLSSLEDQLKIISRARINDNFVQLKSLQHNLEEINSHFDELRNQLTNIDSEISNLENQKKNTKIAISKINYLLTLTFGSKNRLELVEADLGYAVKVRGQIVHPDMISTGERNILALCYFFIKSQDNTEEDSIFKHEKFYVIDDPISSFDDANRIGVLTLLNQIFYKILAGNSDSKVLLLTHDLWTMQSLDSNFKAINNSLTSKTFINLCHLKKQSLANNNVKSLNRYKMYLFNVYKFASTQSKQSELYTDIGNEIRKVLEAYFTFNFANGIDYLSQQEIFKENLTLADYAEYFQGRVLKLFFHDDSHMENTIKYLTDGRFYDEDEIKRAAQDVLVFLFLHNKQHIFNYLATSQKNAILEDCYQVNEHELEDNLNKWKSNIDMELGL
ncbi:MAG: AAA family ATPase [Succinivibrio sp.]|nr:AAA family ATPase [Succinivibrio sp.]